MVETKKVMVYVSSVQHLKVHQRRMGARCVDICLACCVATQRVECRLSSVSRALFCEVNFMYVSSSYMSDSQDVRGQIGVSLLGKEKKP